MNAPNVLLLVCRREEHGEAAGIIGREALGQVTNQFPQLERIPHPRFAEDGVFAYQSKRNTDLITEIFGREATGRDPFFVFTNDVGPHWPYSPPEHCQRHYFDRPLSYRELLDVNDEARPIEHLERVARGDPPDEGTLDRVRRLYYGEVRSVDEQLGNLLESLERHGLSEETLIVVVADHGDNLGETDELGESNVGHQSSGSDALARVPLVVANHALDAATVDEWVSTRNVARLIDEASASRIDDAGDVVEAPRPGSGMAFCEFAANGRAPSVEDERPDVDVDRRRSVLARRRGTGRRRRARGPHDGVSYAHRDVRGGERARVPRVHTGTVERPWLPLSGPPTPRTHPQRRARSTDGGNYIITKGIPTTGVGIGPKQGHPL